MRISLSTPRRYLLFAAVCLALLTVYVARVARMFVAEHALAGADLGALEKAARLEPGNAEVHRRLGLMLLFSQHDPREALRRYESAVQLNPRNAQYWVELAAVHQTSGHSQSVGEALRRAIEAEPTNSRVAWDAANFFVVENQPEEALRLFRIVLAHDADNFDHALRICWRILPDAGRLLRDVLPPQAGSYLRFLRFLVEKEEAAASDQVWDELTKLGQPFAPAEAFRYFDYLLARGESARALSAWEFMLAGSQQVAAEQRSPNLVFNPGFENTILGGGLDWRYHPTPGITVRADSSDFHGAQRSMSISFDGASIDDTGLVQYIPLEPNTRYEFSAFVKAVDLVTTSGPRLAVVDFHTREIYLLTADLRGSGLWRQVQGDFETTGNTTLVALSILRRPGTPVIRGKLLIDDLKLVRK